MFSVLDLYMSHIQIKLLYVIYINKRIKWIYLALNENISYFFWCYDLDSFDEELEDTKEKRNDAIVIVDEIIDEELSVFIEWLQEAPLRALLRQYKIRVYKKIKDCFKEDYEEIDLQINTNRIMRKLVKQAETTLSEDKIDAIIIEEVSLLKEANVWVYLKTKKFIWSSGIVSDGWLTLLTHLLLLKVKIIIIHLIQHFELLVN